MITRVDDSAKRGIESSSITGAIFFGVCRGKISEGIDFKDFMARGVLAVSIPYPNTRSHQVQLMREYMDQRHSIDPSVQTGSSWYNEQAFRALNQGLGRCIRHSRDYGAIIILESRFVNKEMQKKLSRWFRDVIRIAKSDRALIQELKAFYASCQRNFSCDSSVPQESAEQRQMSQEFSPSQELQALQASQTTQVGSQMSVESVNPDRSQSTQPSVNHLPQSTQPSVNHLTQSTQPSVNRVDTLFSDNSTDSSMDDYLDHYGYALPYEPQVLSSVTMSQRIPGAASSSATSSVFDASALPGRNKKRCSSCESQSPLNSYPVDAATSFSLKRAQTMSLQCPICSALLSNTVWRDKSVSVHFGHDLILVAISTLQMHGYKVRLPNESSSLQVKICDASAVLALQSHLCLSADGLINTMGNRADYDMEDCDRDQIR